MPHCGAAAAMGFSVKVCAPAVVCVVDFSYRLRMRKQWLRLLLAISFLRLLPGVESIFAL
jgi:hypothetical protein